MKTFAISFLAAMGTWLVALDLRASESAPDRESAVETLRIGIATHPEQAVVLFQDSLQTNPDCRRDLLVTALGILGDDPAQLTRLLYAARLEFPEDDAVFAEAALSTVPDLPAEIRACFAVTSEQMRSVLAGAPVEPLLPTPATQSLVAPPFPKRPPSEESRRIDEEIREAISRVSAKSEGRTWPEQSAPNGPVQYRKGDEVRISQQSRLADEASLFNHLPLDQNDEREIAVGSVKIDDARRKDDTIRLDESKFSDRGRTGSTSPLDATIKSRTLAGSVALPRRPPMPRSSVYYIPPAKGSYKSTIDLEQGETAPPALIIRPESASPTSPRREAP